MRHLSSVSPTYIAKAIGSTHTKVLVLFSDQPSDIKIETLGKIISLFQKEISRSKLSPDHLEAVKKIFQSLDHRLTKAQNSWDLSFLDQLSPLESLGPTAFVVDRLGYIDNPAADNKKKNVVQIQADLTQLVIDLRGSNNAEDAELRNILIALLKTLLVLLGEGDANPPSKIPKSTAKDAKSISDHLKELETSSESARKTYANASTILGGLLKLFGIDT